MITYRYNKVAVSRYLKPELFYSSGFFYSWEELKKLE